MNSRFLPILDQPGHTNRTRMTCVYKCGDACAHEAPNTSSNEYFRDIAAQALSRRDALRAGGVVALAVGGAAAFAQPAAAQSVVDTASAGEIAGAVLGGNPAPVGTTFVPVVANTADAVVIPTGYEQQVVIRWGDPVLPGAPTFDFENQSAEKAASQFGYNCDFAGLLPFPGSLNRFLFVSNHEYTAEPMMFRGYDGENPTRTQAEVAWASHGLSVVEVRNEIGSGALTPHLGELNRRITATTECELRGPAVGPLTRTSVDSSGTRVLGTLNNCAGGVTPWGTVLTGEENFNQYFGTASTITDPQRIARLARYGMSVRESYRKWERFDKRFDLAQEPNEPHRFGYVVEVNPWDTTSAPVKHSAMGRFKHEGATVYLTADNSVVIYSGDDERFDYIYKFVSSRKMISGNSRASMENNMRILDEGTLYVATFSGNSPAAQIDGSGAIPADGKFDGSGQWIPLLTVDSTGKADSHVAGMSAEEVSIFTRLAGDKVGATKMDRPEDIEPNPVTGKVYCALTNNSKRTVQQVDEANPRPNNKHGQVLEIEDEHLGTTFGWSLLLVCGDPKEADTYYGGFDKSLVSAISCPDNVCFDPYGNLWVSTDGNKLGTNDGLYLVGTDGIDRGQVKCFLTVPIGAETCGPIVTRDRVMVNVQHPGEGAAIENPQSNWPDGGSSQPRPASVVVWKTGGQSIGSSTGS